MADFDDYYDDAQKRHNKPSGSTKGNSFNSAYNRDRIKSTTVPRPSPSPAAKKPTVLPPLGTPDSEPLDPVSWVIDIISRGAYGFNQVGSNAVDESVNVIKNLNKPGGSDIGDMLAGVGNALGRDLVGDDSFLSAFFGNDPDRKDLGSDLIEESNDKYGKAFNPNYKDVVDNVAPYVKGPVGLGLDIFADPTNLIPGKVLTAPVTGTAKVLWHGGKALPVVGKTAAAQAIPGARALGYKGFATGMRAFDAEREAVRAAAEARVSGQTPPAAGPAQHPATAGIPPKSPQAGATGIAQRATPTAPLSPLGQAVQNIVNLTKTGGSKIYGAALSSEAKMAMDYYSARSMARKPRTAMSEMAEAEARVHRAEGDVIEEARQAVVAERVAAAEPEPVVRNERQAGRRAQHPGTTVPAGSNEQRFQNREEVGRVLEDQAEAADAARKQANAPAAAAERARLDAHNAAQQKTLDERLIDQQKAVGGASIPIPDSRAVADEVVPEAPIVVNREPLPEGAAADLALELSRGRNVDKTGKPVLGWHTNTLIQHSGTDVPKDIVRKLLDREAGIKGSGKPLTAAEATVLENIRHDAAIGLRRAQEAKLHATAVEVAAGVPKKVVEQAPIKTTDDLYNILRKSSFLPELKAFMGWLERMAHTTAHPFGTIPRRENGALAGTLKYRNSEMVGTGIFDPKYDVLRESAMHHWLSENGGLVEAFGDGPYELLLRDGTLVSKTPAELRELVSRLSDPENSAILKDAATGREFIGPDDLAEVDGMIIEALWKDFYLDLSKGRVVEHGAEESVVIADALEALKYMVEHKYSRLQEILGPLTAKSIRETLGDNPAKVVSHFEALSRVVDDTFTVDQLGEMLQMRQFQMKGGQSVLAPVFADMGKFPEYMSWLHGKKIEQGAVRPPAENPMPPKAGQVPTPPKAIPKDVDPAGAAEAIVAPSSVTPHPVGIQGVMDEVKAIRGPAANEAEQGWRVGIANALLRIFDRTILKPQGLSHNPAPGVYIEGLNAIDDAYRVDLWNMPKQVEFAQMVDRILTDHFDDIRAKEGGLEGDWGKYSNRTRDPKGARGGMPYDVADKFEDRYLLEALEVVDAFLSKMGVKQVIGTDVKTAIPISLGDIVGAVHHHTTPRVLEDGTEFAGKYGARSESIRRMLLTGGARPGSSKVNWSNLMEGTRIHLQGGSREDVVAALLNNRKQGIRGELVGPMPEAATNKGVSDLGMNPNNWNNPAYSATANKHFLRIGDKAKSEWLEIFPNATFRANVKGGKTVGWYMDIPGEDLANVTADLIDDMSRDLGNIAIQNGWRGKNATMEGSDIILGELVGDNFKAMAADPARTPELIQHLAGLDKTANTVAERELLTHDAELVAVERAEAELGPDLVAGAKHEVEVSKAKTEPERAKAISKGQKKMAKEAQEVAHQATTEHLSEMLENPAIMRELTDGPVSEPRTVASMQSPMEEGGPHGFVPERLGPSRPDEVIDHEYHELLDDGYTPDEIAAYYAREGRGLPPTVRPPQPASAGGAGRSGGNGTTATPAGTGGRGGAGTPNHVAAADEVTQVFDMNAAYEKGYLNSLGMMVFNTGKFFNASLGMSGLWKGVHGAGVLANSYLAKVNDDLAELARTFDKGTLDTAFNLIQKGGTHSDPQVMAAVEELNKKVNLLWSTQGDAVLGNAFLGVEPKVTHLNEMLRKYFTGSGNDLPQFDIQVAETLRRATPGMSLGDALAVQWRDWPVRDSIDFVTRLMSAAVNVAEHRAVVNLFDTNMAKWGGSSATHIPGWQKPAFHARNSKDSSSFIHFIDQDLYYPTELLNELRHADIFVTTSRQVAGESANWIRKVYAPTLNAWKRAMTINRPGHHIRNAVGDMIMTYVIRGHHLSGQSTMDAAKIHGSAGQYSDMDFMMLLQDLHKEGIDPRKAHEVNGQVQIPRFDEELFEGVGPNGQPIKYTIGQASDHLHGNGLRPTYIAGEGLFDNPEMAGKYAGWMNNLSLESTAYGRLAGTASQARDHFQRTQHFMQIMRQEMSANRKGAKFRGQWKTVDDLATLAAKEVQRYHPDASMLTPKEAKIMRLIFPFYSWQAKIMPAFFESFLRNPGRVSNMTKANYEFAVSMGVNPDSVYDPFPTDQAFPDYMHNRVLGPQFEMPNGEYWGFDPGVPQFDMLSDFVGTGTAENGGPLGSILSNVLGSVTPAVRAPLELAAGQQVGGIPILDKSEYIDSQIPGVSYLNNVTGSSLTGTLGLQGLFGDTDEIDPNHETPFDTRRQVREGNYQGPINEQGLPSGDALNTLFNWIFGLGAHGMSHPNQMNGGTGTGNY